MPFIWVSLIVFLSLVDFSISWKKEVNPLTVSYFTRKEYNSWKEFEQYAQDSEDGFEY